MAENQATRRARPAVVSDGPKPKLLFLCQTLPFPPDGGVQIRSFNILRLLSRSFDVTALCFYREATRSSPQAVDVGVTGLEEYARVQAFPIPQEHSRMRLIWDHARSVLLWRVYTRFVYESEAFTARLKRLLRDESFDIVHMDSLDLSGYLPDLKGLPVVCTHHNVESALLMRRAESQRSRIKRSYLRLQARLMEAEERSWCGTVALNVTVSDEDARELSALAPDAEVKVVPNGVDTKVFKPGESGDHGLVFVGGYSWYPNRDAIEYFVEDILPLLRDTHEDLPVTWVGRSPESVRQMYAEEHGVRLTGYVDSIEPYVADAACYVVPMRVGGGTRLKILDAWALGKAVVSTSVGCEGLEARDGENLLVRDTPREFAAAVRRVLTDPYLRERLASAARDTAERVYDWDIIGKAMLEGYEALLRAERPTSE